MALMTEHNVERGIARLLGGPIDLEDQIENGGIPVSLAEASAMHRDLYRDYLQQLPEVYQVAEGWWIGCVHAYVSQGLSEEAALDQAFSRRIAGPASEPQVINFFRTFWLRCAALNRDLPETQRIPPQTLLLQWLVEEDRQEFVTLITCMPYWPVGLDEHGNWC